MWRARDAVPPPEPITGYDDTVVTHLRMERRPANLPLTPPRDDLGVMRATPPTLSFYRYLYDAIGEAWTWTVRRVVDQRDLLREISNPEVHIQVLYVGGVPAGFAEIDQRQHPRIQIAYFGLMPEFVGQGLGQFFLAWAIDRCFSDGAAPLLLNTCEHDHPRALPTYINAGFVPQRRHKQKLALIKSSRPKRTRRSDQQVFGLIARAS